MVATSMFAQKISCMICKLTALLEYIYLSQNFCVKFLDNSSIQNLFKNENKVNYSVWYTYTAESRAQKSTYFGENTTKRLFITSSCGTVEPVYYGHLRN